jgi:hypothetical protein
MFRPSLAVLGAFALGAAAPDDAVPTDYSSCDPLAIQLSEFDGEIGKLERREQMLRTDVWRWREERMNLYSLSPGQIDQRIANYRSQERRFVDLLASGQTPDPAGEQMTPDQIRWQIDRLRTQIAVLENRRRAVAAGGWGDPDRDDDAAAAKIRQYESEIGDLPAQRYHLEARAAPLRRQLNECRRRAEDEATRLGLRSDRRDALYGGASPDIPAASGASDPGTGSGRDAPQGALPPSPDATAPSGGHGQNPGGAVAPPPPRPAPAQPGCVGPPG